MNLPEYAKAGHGQGEIVGTTSERLYGSPVIQADVYMGVYHDTNPDVRGTAGEWTSAVVVRARHKGHDTEMIVRDPDLLAAWASQLLTGSLQLRRSLEQELL